MGYFCLFVYVMWWKECENVWGGFKIVQKLQNAWFHCFSDWDCLKDIFMEEWIDGIRSRISINFTRCIWFLSCIKNHLCFLFLDLQQKLKFRKKQNAKSLKLQYSRNIKNQLSRMLLSMAKFEIFHFWRID